MKRAILSALGLLVLNVQLASGAHATVPALNKVMWIWMENVSSADMMTYKYIRNVWRNNPSVTLQSYTAISKVTQANTIAMVTGSDNNVVDNSLIRIGGAGLVGLLQAKTIPWKVYVQSFPGGCFLGPGTSDYQRYRVPFLSLDSVETDRFLCMNVVGFKYLTDDVQRGTLPQFSVVIPGLSESGATSDTSTATSTLQALLDPLLANPDIMAQTTIFISTTNGSGTTDPNLFSMVIGNGITNFGQSVNTAYNHYSVLRTIEDGMGLGTLGQKDAQAADLDGFWTPPTP